ncbi:MAG: hypothetical protein A2Y97_04670 [Nitrospirae bacterium RBG_13_39_12]|nr:MAG: hypothetical protein A2Y97_04670 [Nitrospirae bacterium RBG_13_39_12]
MLKNILNFFLSLRLSIWLIFVLLSLLFYGSFVMPKEKEFQTLNTIPLFQWMNENNSGITWWLWAAIGILVLLTVNTLLCSIESVIKKRVSKHWILIISPQLIHVGFLFILFSHLLSSYGSFRGTAFVYEGSALQLPNGLTVVFAAINTDIDHSGFIKNWSADIKYFDERRQMTKDVISPNNPSFQDGFGIYIKTVRLEPVPAALIEVSREPGAFCALVGGVLFLAGMVTLLIFKMKKEDARI